jgi:hypothetical protein
MSRPGKTTTPFSGESARGRADVDARADGRTGGRLADEQRWLDFRELTNSPLVFKLLGLSKKKAKAS